MSKIQVNEIVNHFDTGAPDCPKGLTVTGFTTFSGGSSFSGDVSIGGSLTYEDVTNINSVGIITANAGIDISNTIVANNDSTIRYDNDTFHVKVDANNVRGSSTFKLDVDDTNAITIDDNRRIGIGTSTPTEILSVDGAIESLSDGGDSASEGGELILRAPRTQTGTKYRYIIDNYWGDSSYGRATGGNNEVNGIRLVREDDADGNNGAVLMSIAQDGIMFLPYQPAFDSVYDSGGGGTGYTTANTEIIFNVTNNNRGNHLDTSTGRFTAPITGSYVFSFGLMNDGSTGGTTAWAELRVNGSLLNSPHNPYMSVQNGSGFRFITATYVLQLNDGDYVSVFTGSTTGGVYGGGNNHNFFSGHLIG